MQLQEPDRALERLDAAAAIYGRSDAPHSKMLSLARDHISRGVVAV